MDVVLLGELRPELLAVDARIGLLGDELTRGVGCVRAVGPGAALAAANHRPSWHCACTGLQNARWRVRVA